MRYNQAFFDTNLNDGGGGGVEGGVINGKSCNTGILQYSVTFH